MPRSLKLECASVSDTGRRRPHNEDSAATDTGLGLAVIADGMGGYKAGEVASAIAVVTVWDEIRTGITRLNGRAGGEEAGGLSAAAVLVREAILTANRRIFETAQREPSCQNMGTTVVTLLLAGDRITIAHVGDSRMYRFRNGSLSQVTSDHSLLQEVIDRGFFTAAEAAEHVQKNLVTRALGVEPSVEVSIREEPYEDGDVFLLCTDGLNDMVNDEDISATLSKHAANLLEAAAELVRLANAGGGKDNVTVVLARAHPASRNGWFPWRLGETRGRKA